MITLKASRKGMEAASVRLTQLLAQLTDLKPFMQAAAEYMVRSTQYRIRQGKTSPDGSVPPALAALTVLLKGHNKPWYQTGKLRDGIAVDRVTAEGFVIRATALNAKGRDYAARVQFGNAKQRGAVTLPDGSKVHPRTPQPARPFLGFSDENLRHVSRMLQEHVLKQNNR